MDENNLFDVFKNLNISGSLSDEELCLFTNYLNDKSGIYISPEKGYLFETRLSKMMVDCGVDTFREFYDYIISGEDPKIEQKIINAMTINETLWFRDAAPWKALEGVILPNLIEKLRSGEKSKVRIWFSAVSTGQEAYSTVMCIDNYLKTHNIGDIKLSDFDFLATDISTRVLKLAKAARYDGISIKRGLDDYYRERYFVNDNLVWSIDAAIRDAVKFTQLNLKNPYVMLGGFDIIFCRYVLIYFSKQLQKEVVRKMHSILKADGILFTGSYVMYDLFGDLFETNYFGNLTYYSKKAVSI